MTKTGAAIFDGHVLRPEAALDLELNGRYQITIEPLEPQVAGVEGNAWDTLARLAGGIEGPADWSSEHGHYLYGTPKGGHSADRGSTLAGERAEGYGAGRRLDGT